MMIPTPPRPDHARANHRLRRACRCALRGGIRRLCGLPEEDQGQVMVMTAVMVFIVALASISSLNTSELLYNRIRTQNAADAAADAFALWQARAFNFNQHLNDFHMEAQIYFTTATLLTCVKRFVNLSLIGIPGGACQQRYCSPRCSGCRRVCSDYGLPAVKSCCRQINKELSDIEQQQAMMSNLILAVQGLVDVIAPQIGWLAANEVAAGNGADALDSPALRQEIVTTLAELGVNNYDIDALMASGMAPSGSIHTVPLLLPILKMVPMLPTGGMGNPLTAAIPIWTANGRCVIPGIHDAACMLSTCGDGGALWCVIYWPILRSIVPGFIRNLIGPSSGCAGCFTTGIIPYVCSTSKPPCINIGMDDMCQFLLRDLDECDYGCTAAGIDRASSAGNGFCGWHDTFYMGSPMAYTWITAKDQRNLGGMTMYEKLRWFNPSFDATAQGEFKDMGDNLTYETSDDYAFDRTSNMDSSGDFRNARFMAMASCTARGHEDLLMQPLTMYATMLVPGGFGYCRPQLINVHLDPLGLSDDTADDNIIWH